MPATSMKIQSEVRDQLARVAAKEFPGATLSDVLARLLAEHEQARTQREITVAYAHLQEDPAAWADYVSELDEWDAVTADGIE
ncbi:MAG TPA: hypothetical protein VMU51_11255 [Mycobacteriales bacterium]|nr:hypothetical protein [Mycobacteriales bacterium]